MLWQCQIQKAFLSVYSLLYPRLPFDKLPTHNNQGKTYGRWQKRLRISFKDIGVILNKIFEEKTEEEEEQTEIIDTGIAAGSVDRSQQLQSMEFIFSPNSSKNYE